MKKFDRSEVLHYKYTVSQIDYLRLRHHFGWLFGFQYFRGFSPFTPKHQFRASPKHGPGYDDILDLLNVRIIIVPMQAKFSELKGYRLLKEYQAGNFKLVINEDCLPRAFVLTSESARQFIGEDVEIPSPEKLEMIDGGKCIISSYRNNEVIITVEMPETGWLVLSDRFYPGWRVKVDGETAEIVPFARWLRAVEIGPGHHQVRFSYLPGTFIAGSLITLLALVIISILKFWEFRLRPDLLPPSGPASPDEEKTAGLAGK